MKQYTFYFVHPIYIIISHSPNSSQVTVNRHESCHASADLPESRHVSADHLESRHS